MKKVTEYINRYADQLGIAGSVICIIHCMALPLLVGLLTAYTHSKTPSWEWGMDLSFILLAFIAVRMASKTTLSILRKILWSFFIVFSISVILSGILSYSHYLTYIGSLGLIVTHILNIYYKRKHLAQTASL